jgi:hypothetical protein
MQQLAETQFLPFPFKENWLILKNIRMSKMRKILVI